jgi:hypothetical protein
MRIGYKNTRKVRGDGKDVSIRYCDSVIAEGLL